MCSLEGSIASYKYQLPVISVNYAGACSFPVTTARETTECNVMPPIPGPPETYEYSFHANPSAPTPPLHISTPYLKCTRCVKNSKSTNSLTKEHCHVKKCFIKMQEKITMLQAVEVNKKFQISNM